MEPLIETKTKSQITSTITPSATPAVKRGGGKSKKVLGWVLVVVVIVALAVGGWWYKSRETAPEGIVNGKDAIALEVRGIVENLDFDACNSIKDAEYKIICKNNVAIELAHKELDTKWCMELDNQMISRDSCVYSVIIGKAVESGNPDICNSASDLGYSELVELCINDFWSKKAIDNNQESFCNNIKDKEEKDNCVSNVILSGFIKDPTKYNCSQISGFGIESEECEKYKETKSCDSLINETLKEWCSFIIDILIKK